MNLRGPVTASNQEWERSLSFLIERTHSTADLVFRGFAQELEPRIRGGSISQDPASLAGLCQSNEDESDWPNWIGIGAGLERLNGQLLTVQSFLQYPTPVPVTVPVFKVVGLIDRILSVLPPSETGSRSADTGTPTKPELSREEREAVWTYLPHLHISTLNLAEQLIRRLDECSVSLTRQLLDSVLCLFEHEHSHVEIREAVYRILPPLLAHCASGLPRSLAAPAAACLRVCCDDLVSTPADTGYRQGNGVSSGMTSNKSAMNADAYLQKPDASLTSRRSSGLQELSASLLSAALVHLPAAFPPFSVRSKIDRSAVLAQNNLLMQVSVLNATGRRGRKQQSSLLPLLSRHFPNSYDTEALIRPRLPPLQPSSANLSDGGSDEEVDAKAYREENIDRISAETPDASMNGSSRAVEGSNGHDTTELMRLETENLRSESQPLASSLHETIQQGPETKMSAKRVREPDPSNMDFAASHEPKHLLAPGGEPKRKRMRDSDDEIYVPPATEDDFPPPVAPFPPSDPTPSLAEIQPSDDDSDDSSIPPIDPTPDTEDEDSDDDDDAGDY
ncbi:MAG: hypothetical protein Q9196_002878 [Gyalolechia fulgens]